MIVKDEEPVLARCLDCVKSFADEIIVVDTGSSDHSKKIAQHYTKYVYDFEWCDDFAAARNYSYSFATCDYIMWLDADDVIEAQDCERIAALKNLLTPDIEVVYMLYRAAQRDNHETAVLRDRLIRRDLGAKWEYPVHEGIPMSTAAAGDRSAKYKSYAAKDITIWHKKMAANDPARNIRIFEKMLDQGVPFSLFNYSYYCRELYIHQRYEESYQAYLKVKDSRNSYNIAHALPFSTWSLQRLNRWQDALQELCDALEFIAPTPLICCEIGNCFFQLEMLQKAESWYLQALSFTLDLDGYTLVFPAYYDYIPFQKLCKLYARSGNLDKAIAYNERAASVRPDSASAALNRLYFKKILY
ncbi:MAG: glycosyltransferase [Syntrophomonas sp.]